VNSVSRSGQSKQGWEMDSIYKASLREIPVDLFISNATIFNSITAEFLDSQSVWVKDGLICYVGEQREPLIDGNTEIIDAQGKVLLPGLIEGHTHILNFTGLEEFIRHVIPSGTTTVVTETIELATIAGLEGFTHFIEGLRNQPIRLYYTISPLCGLTEEQEKHAPQESDYERFFKDPLCLGLGEIYWSNMLLKGGQGGRVRRLAEMAKSHRKLIEGHTAGASDLKLQAYTSMGPTSCHEPITEQEAIERLRLGYWVMIRQGAIRKELDEVVGVFFRNVDARRVIICTDSMDPESFITHGSLDAAVKRALELGVQPAKVYQGVTINVAEHFHLDHLIGSITPGKKADMLLIPAPDDYRPEWVMCNGRMIYTGGQLRTQVRKVAYPEHFFDSVRLGPLPEIAPPQTGKVRVMELVTRLVTVESMADLDDPEQRYALNLLLAIDRTGKPKSFLGMIKNFGLNYGAVGSTMCWDSQDMYVVGCDPQSMLTVMEKLAEMGGGAVAAHWKTILGQYPARLCGVVSVEAMEAAHEKIKNLEMIIKDMGVRWEKPILTLNTLGTAAIPHLRINHQGYVRLKDRAILPLKIPG